MKFYIITPTYNRSDSLIETIDSVIAQSYSDWNMIIVNDSPSDVLYSNVENKIKNNPKIIYTKNTENKGVNFSRNVALDIVKKDTKDDDWVLFLDDDDTFSKDALENIVNIIKTHPNEKWILTNRASDDSTSFTKAPKTDKEYSYVFDYLIFKNIKGDATHSIKAREIKNIRFSKKVKQGEEWIFFYELSLHIKNFFYHYVNSTFSKGYDMTGLNFRKRSKKEKLIDLYKLKIECIERNIMCHPSLWLYIFVRFIFAIIK